MRRTKNYAAVLNHPASPPGPALVTLAANGADAPSLVEVRAVIAKLKNRFGAEVLKYFARTSVPLLVKL